MEIWIKLSICVSVYGFLKEMQPLDPYITQYLVNPPMNFTEQVVRQDIYPIATYVCLAELILVFLLTDWLRYRPVIFLNAISNITMMILLIWCRSLESMWAMEFFFGTTISSEVAYYTYIYTSVDKEHYQEVTSYVRTAALMGRFFGCMTSQILLVTASLSLLQINYIQLVGGVISLLWAFQLPPAKTSLYFHRCEGSAILSNSEEKQSPSINNCELGYRINAYSETVREHVTRVPCKIVFSRLWNDFKFAYTNPYTFKWSVWWAFNLCGFNQEGTYAQTLWQNMNNDDSLAKFDILKYTGVTESIFTLAGAGAAFSVAYIRIDWEKRGDILMSLCSIAEGLLILWASRTSYIWQAFVSHVLFAAVYYFSASVAYAEVAKNISSDSYALVFGFNTFIALVLQTFLTAIFNGRGGFELSSRSQFVVYGGYFLFNGFICISIFLYSMLVTRKRSKQ